MARRLALTIAVLCQLWAAIAGLQVLPAAPEQGMAIIVAIALACTSIHEAGHAIAVLCFRASIDEICVWGLGYDFRNRQFGPLKTPVYRDIGGFVKYRSSRILHQQERAMIAVAGPLANATTATLSIAFTYYWPVDGNWYGSAMIFVVFSAGMAAANLVPFDGSDGATILAYIRERGRGKTLG